jgi:hypothetical protein
LKKVEPTKVMSLQLKAIFFGWFVVFAQSTGWSTSVTSEDRPAIPADLFCQFTPVPDGENAIIDWREAGTVSVPLSDKQKQTIKYCWTPTAREPDVNDLDGLHLWLTQNREALDLFQVSLQKPKAQWPEQNPKNTQPELKSLTLIVRARLFQADQLAEHNNFEAATKSLEESSKLAQMGIEGDGELIHYLVACGARTLTQDAILRLASRKRVPVSLLQELLKNLPSLNSETNIYSRVLRVEFTYDDNKSIDYKKIVQDWSKMSKADAVTLLSFYPDNLKSAVRVMLDPALVALHPNPLDVKSEIEKTIRQYRIYRTNSLVPWTKRNGEVELDDVNDRALLAQEIAPLMELLKNDPLPLSRAAAEKARASYVKIENPVGRILDTSVIGFMASDLKTCQVRTEREATRACLALIIFERQKGELPATLSDLVQQRILDSVPIDPFCGEPLHYSPENRKLWSVSDDGVDDHGTSGRSRWYGKDAVWQIPELN